MDLGHWVLQLTKQGTRGAENQVKELLYQQTYRTTMIHENDHAKYVQFRFSLKNREKCLFSPVNREQQSKNICINI